MSASKEAQAEDFNPLGPVRLGVLVGIGIPSPASAQLLFKYKEVVGANLELGMLPTLSVPIGHDVKIHQEMIDFSLRLYPFKGAFFLGCGLGAQKISVNGKETSNGHTGTGSASVNTTFVSPRLGFVHKFDFGLALGMDIGAEIPIGGSVDVSIDAGGVSLSPPKEVVDLANTIKSTPIPIIHLLQVGYIF